jgi:hypothetical protein
MELFRNSGTPICYYKSLILRICTYHQYYYAHHISVLGYVYVGAAISDKSEVPLFSNGSSFLSPLFLSVITAPT